MEKIISIEYVKDGNHTRKTPFKVDGNFYDSVQITVQEKDEIGHWNITKTIGIPINSINN